MPHSPRLQLAPHVRACYSDGQVILLDLRRNKYLGVGGAQLAALAGVVKGWPACPAPSHRAVVDWEALIRPLRLQRLFIEEADSCPTSPELEEASMSLNAEDEVYEAAVGLGRMYRIAASAAITSFRLRKFTLKRITDTLADRRARLERQAPPASLDSVRSAVAAYRRLQPFLFTSRERCLHDSLALVQFLASERILAHWVIGVTTRPFAAHSWVQRGGIVLNDQHEHVRRFQPILFV